MIGQKHRFHGYGSLKAVYQKGQTVRGSALSLRFSSRDSNKTYRAAIVVSKKVHKSAVVRNRIRRRIYEIIRKNTELIPGGTDLVITVFSDQVADLPAPKLESSVIGLLKKLH